MNYHFSALSLFNPFLHLRILLTGGCLLIFLNALEAQIKSSSLPVTTSIDFECSEASGQANLLIYNAFYDWGTGMKYSGNEVSGSVIQGDIDGDGIENEEEIGAVTVANKNDTDGDGLQDNLDTDVTSTVGRNEIDLMKLLIKKPSPDVGGNVTLTIVEGSIKLWETPFKLTPVITDTNGSISFPVSTLLPNGKILFIEATEPSVHLRDIVLKLVYNGSEDIVKATAVWVEKTEHWSEATAIPDPDVDLGNIGDFIKGQVSKNIAENGTRYGHGDCRITPISDPSIGWTDNSANDKEYGGRILMEWVVMPPNAKELFSFDLTRQRKTTTWYIDYGEAIFSSSSESTDFPFESGLDNEKPNDDGNEGSEDRTPMNDILYSWDNPTIPKKYPPQANRAFFVSKNWFKEFVRVRAIGSPFTDTDNLLTGSRASNKFDWRCVYYARKDDGLELSIDAESASHCHLKSPTIDVDDYFVTAINASAVSYEVGAFTITYKGVNSVHEKELEIFRFDGVSYISQTFTIPESQTIWEFTFEGVQFILNETNAVPDMTIMQFNTFKTNASSKENIIGAGEYTNFTR